MLHAEENPHISEKKRWKRCPLDWKKRAHLDLCTCVCGGVGGCFVASDWLKKQGIKASHVLSIHYPRRKIHLGRDLAGRSLFSILFLHVRYKKKTYFLLKERQKRGNHLVCH